MLERRCTYCNEIVEGRSDKKFCSQFCKSAYHYKINIGKADNLYVSIDKALKRNRKLLKAFNKAGKATVRKDDLIKEGFNPKYFTNYWKNNRGEVYLFCYEYGFLEREELGKKKYVLVKWQDYMNI